MFLDDLHIPYERNVPLGPHTWYGVGGPADILARPSSVQQLAALAARANDQRWPVWVLGSGANLLVSDVGVRGLVIKLDDPCFRQVTTEGSRVTAGAGFDLAKLVLQTAKAGLGGLECLAGVPASVGGAVRMNAGGRFGDIGRCIRRIQVMDGSGHVYYRDREDLVFSYRKSSIVARFILAAEFNLTPDDPETLMHEVKRIFMLKSESQPLGDHSAGCSFKNPPPDPEGQPRSAGKLIDSAGLKGYRVGGAEISPQHANFTVAHPGCTAADILAVMSHAQQVVADRFGVTLEREVVFWS